MKVSEKNLISVLTIDRHSARNIGYGFICNLTCNLLSIADCTWYVNCRTCILFTVNSNSDRGLNLQAFAAQW